MNSEHNLDCLPRFGCYKMWGKTEPLLPPGRSFKIQKFVLFKAFINNIWNLLPSLWSGLCLTWVRQGFLVTRASMSTSVQYTVKGAIRKSWAEGCDVPPGIQHGCAMCSRVHQLLLSLRHKSTFKILSKAVPRVGNNGLAAKLCATAVYSAVMGRLAISNKRAHTWTFQKVAITEQAGSEERSQ